MDEGSSPPGQYKAVKEVEEIEEYWKNLIDSEISDSTQLNTFYQTYVSSYGPQSTATNAIRMEHAKALAFACLKHYYPASQGYKIEPASLGPFAKHGMNFILAKEDQTDIWKDLPVKNLIEEAKRKKKRAPTKKELKKAYMAAQADQYNHGIAWTMGIRWNWIKPQDIAAFAVERQRKVTNGTTGITTCEWSLYTYLAIIIDTFDELPNFSIENTLHRSDVLAHPLSQAGNVQEGYGILLYGRRLEFYHFSAGEDWYLDNENEERDTEDFEPKVQVLASGARELAMDLRTTPLPTLDETFKEVAGMKVVYKGETNTSSEQDSGVGSGQD